MLESNINFETFFLLCFIYSLVLSESNINLHSAKSSHVVKRHDNDFQTCLDNFDVHQDKIIRTQDSRDMGAKYLNEHDVLSRDECLRLCCETENCDVFVYEEKTPGSCYLFECGTPEDFKCKFTKHKNYTSAVLAINRHLTELESQIKFTQHEHELTKLRQPPEPIDISKNHPSTTESSKNQESIKYGIERPPSQLATTKRQGCSRYQFECHTSGECIAIYNACDGIPQCADGSDEAAELGCPATSTVPTITTVGPSKAELKEHKTIQDHKKEQVEANVGDPPKQIQQSYIPEGPMLNGGYAQNPALPNVPSSNLRASYGREGEGMANYHPEQQWSYQYHPSQGSSQIFTHKGNGLVVPQQNERYSQHQYVPQDVQQRPVLPQYSEQLPNDYNKYYYDNMGYRMAPQGQAVNTWQAPHKNHVPNQILDDGSMNRLDNLPVANNVPGPDYYYEEGYRNRPQPFVPRVPVPPPQHPSSENKTPEMPMESSNDNAGMKHDVPKKKPPTHAPEVTTLKPKEVTASHVSHRKIETISADLKMKESSLEDELDGHNPRPSGAVLSLTLGLCITAIMLIFVGCRMKVVRKRMRRGGKSPYAHDADFLVNGMYL